MKNNVGTFTKLIFLPLSFLVSLFLVLSPKDTLSPGFSSNAQNNQPEKFMPFGITNKTKGIEISSVRREGNEVRVILKNNYQKTITAYAIGLGGYNIKTELSEAESLSSGASRVQKLRFSSGKSENTVNVLAVIFDDRTTDGDHLVIKEMQELRSGKKSQYSRIIPYFNQLIEATDTEMPKTLKRVKAAINNLPVSLESEKDSPSHVAGLRDAKETALRQLEEYEQIRTQDGNAAFKLFINKLRDRFLRDIEILVAPQ
jgi:hypothetical protein